MNLLALVLAGHVIGDWVVQSDWQAAHKPISWLAMQQHMLSYHLTMLLLVGPFWHTWYALIAFVISWITHMIIDRRWPVKRLLEITGSGDFSDTLLGMTAADQALHLAILCLLVAYA